MTRDLHTIAMLPGSPTAFEDRVFLGLRSQLAYKAGNGDPAAIAAGTPGAGYQTIPTVAFANAGAGASTTAAAVMGVVANPTVAAGGSGGTNGAVTLTGTTGTGTKFQVTGTIAGGALTAITGISVAGAYTAMPSSLTAEPVTGGSLTGATVNLAAALGVVGYTVNASSSNHQYAQGTTAAVTGGTPATAAVPGAVTVTPYAGQGTSLPVVTVLPASYVVQATVDQDANVYITGRTQAGFTVNITPRLAGNTLAAGAVDLVIIA